MGVLTALGLSFFEYIQLYFVTKYITDSETRLVFDEVKIQLLGGCFLIDDAVLDSCLRKSGTKSYIFSSIGLRQSCGHYLCNLFSFPARTFRSE